MCANVRIERNRMANQQIIVDALRRSAIDAWGQLNEKDDFDRRRQIECDLEMSPDEIYHEAVAQAFERIAPPPPIVAVSVSAHTLVETDDERGKGRWADEADLANLPQEMREAVLLGLQAHEAVAKKWDARRVAAEKLNH